MWHYRMAKDTAGKFGIYEKHPAVAYPDCEGDGGYSHGDLYGGPVVSGLSEEEVVKKVELYAQEAWPEHFPIDSERCRMILRDLKAFSEPDVLTFEAGGILGRHFLPREQVDKTQSCYTGKTKCINLYTHMNNIISLRHADGHESHRVDSIEKAVFRIRLANENSVGVPRKFVLLFANEDVAIKSFPTQEEAIDYCENVECSSYFICP